MGDTIRAQKLGVGGFRVDRRAKELVMEVLESNRLTAGPMMARFEAAIAASHGRRFGLMTNSCTSSLQIALGALKEKHGWEDGDEVLVPAVTFVASANVVLFNGLKPVFVDVEREYYDIDPECVENHITPRTRAVMPVHIGGLPCDMDPILAIAERHGLRMVEDSAECMFAKYRGRPVGSFGDVGCFSTYAAHIISTGVGGISVTDDGRLQELMKSLMNHGRSPLYTRIDDDEGARGEDLFEIADSRFVFPRLGHSFRATEMEAAVGIAEFEKRHETWQRRLEIVARYDDAFSRYRGFLQLPKLRPDTENAAMFYPIAIVDKSISRAALIRHLEERRIETRYLLPLINQPVYRELYGNLDSEYPVASWLNENAFYIGCHSDLSDADVEYVVDAFASFFESAVARRG